MVAQFAGDEETAFRWAVRELKAYRASKGPVSDRRYEVVMVKLPENSGEPESAGPDGT